MEPAPHPRITTEEIQVAMEPRTIGSLFWYTYDYGFKDAPRLNRKGTTREVDPPYRNGRCWLLRLPFSSASLVLGRWDGRINNEDTAILTATNGRPVNVSAEEIREWD